MRVPLTAETGCKGRCVGCLHLFAWIRFAMPNQSDTPSGHEGGEAALCDGQIQAQKRKRYLAPLPRPARLPRGVSAHFHVSGLFKIKSPPAPVRPWYNAFNLTCVMLPCSALMRIIQTVPLPKTCPLPERVSAFQPVFYSNHASPPHHQTFQLVYFTSGCSSILNVMSSRKTSPVHASSHRSIVIEARRGLALIEGYPSRRGRVWAGIFAFGLARRVNMWKRACPVLKASFLLCNSIIHRISSAGSRRCKKPVSGGPADMVQTSLFKPSTLKLRKLSELQTLESVVMSDMELSLPELPSSLDSLPGGDEPGSSVAVSPRSVVSAASDETSATSSRPTVVISSAGS
ncbi:hypothetical protein F5X68DRAFT_218855 [Plectosphaerella plurivora]|uniref:Uncharacterized protein n=1 Tax=Plectosphaerella plurivora TaxID=936078 RepID=A0A9P8V0H5_9PEZI|nr:hypothetical protein F5X68DRAFT_218855 [Plectosphaerella plurivora]